MKITIILLGILVIASLTFLTSCKKKGVQADVDSAIAQEQYQFIALLDKQGKWTYPQVPEIPDWYFQTTGISMRQTTPETSEADLAYMKNYNDALYQTLKAEGKFHFLEENIAKVKANLDKYKQATQSDSSTNAAAPKN
jgi:hypothetical protein